jgi:hypothetical protein
MTCAAVFSVAGLVANFFGVILLFWFAIPFRIQGGYYGPSSRPAAEERKDARYKLLAYLALALVFLGTAGQIADALVAK